jgi:hypothetical protein
MYIFSLLKRLFIIYKVTFSLHPQQSFLLHILQTNLRVGRARTHTTTKNKFEVNLLACFCIFTFLPFLKIPCFASTFVWIRTYCFSTSKISIDCTHVDLVLCGLFICEFVYLRLQIDHCSGTYPPIYSHSWSFYANSLYASLIFWSLSIAYNEVQLY